MHNRIEMRKDIYKDFLLVMLFAVISIAVVITMWMHYVEDINQLEQRIQIETTTSNNDMPIFFKEYS